MSSQATFIESFENVLPASQCSSIIERFKAEPRVRRGLTGGGVDTALKDSWDLTISNLADWAAEAETLTRAAFQMLLPYVRRYPYLALGPNVARIRLEDGSVSTLDAGRVATMTDIELGRLLTRLFRPGRVNLQRYIAGSGGYPHWHSEIYPQPKATDALHRVLAWTLYLNDEFEGGETEFVHQQYKVKPKTGALMFAPAGFTHTHRGNMPTGGDKFIATSWVMFQAAEKIYGSPKT